VAQGQALGGNLVHQGRPAYQSDMMALAGQAPAYKAADGAGSHD
jgi:hypothetical protein